jgi:hypothetical protein
VSNQESRDKLPQPPAQSGDGGGPRGPGERFFDLSLFWRNQALWPVTFCAVVGLSALGAGAVSMALTQHNPFARLALGVAALITLFGLWDFRSRRGKLGGGALIVAVLWALSIAGGVLLARTGG